MAKFQQFDAVDVQYSTLRRALNAHQRDLMAAAPPSEKAQHRAACEAARFALMSANVIALFAAFERILVEDRAQRIGDPSLVGAFQLKQISPREVTLRNVLGKWKDAVPHLASYESPLQRLYSVRSDLAHGVKTGIQAANEKDPSDLTDRVERACRDWLDAHAKNVAGFPLRASR